VHSRDVQLDLGNRLGQLGDLLLERRALCLRLLGAQEQSKPARVRIGRHSNGCTANARRVTHSRRRTAPLGGLRLAPPAAAISSLPWLLLTVVPTLVDC
jgi:hypothetical protein